MIQSYFRVGTHRARSRPLRGFVVEFYEFTKGTALKLRAMAEREKDQEVTLMLSPDDTVRLLQKLIGGISMNVIRASPRAVELARAVIAIADQAEKIGP